MTKKSKVAITKGARWEAKELLKNGLDLLGGIHKFMKKGDVVLLKPNLGYVTPEGMPPWTCTTDYTRWKSGPSAWPTPSRTTVWPRG